MTTSVAQTRPAFPRPLPHHRLRSAGAVLAAVLVNAVASVATDQLFHALDVYPTWGAPMYDTGDNLLALGYRTLYAILGGWLAARLAPDAPLRHALLFGAIGVVLSGAAAFFTITRFDLGPDWYPLLLVAVALPSAWLGGTLRAGR
jgi:hypothetical protein